MHILIKKFILDTLYIFLVEGKIMIFRYSFLYLVFIFFLLNSCGSSEELSSTNAPEETGSSFEENTRSEKLFYTITNDFQDHHGAAPVYVYLNSISTGESYIVPPTKYSPVELEYVIMDIKVEGECIKIPEEAFPVSVGVCESNECASVRSLSVVLKNPAHYNISGIGGLLTPQIYPVSPCSKDFVELIGSIEEYQTL